MDFTVLLFYFPPTIDASRAVDGGCRTKPFAAGGSGAIYTPLMWCGRNMLGSQLNHGCFPCFWGVAKEVRAVR